MRKRVASGTQNPETKKVQFMQAPQPKPAPTMPLAELIDTLIGELGKLREVNKPKAPTSSPVTVKPIQDMSPEEKVQFDLTVHPGSARRAIAKRLGMTPTEASTLLKTLAKRNLVARIGNRRASRWYLMQMLKDLGQMQ